MSISTTKWSCNRFAVATVVATILLASHHAAFAIDPPANLETAISGALQNHPDLVAAQAKINQARAEYDSVRLEVVRKTVAAWSTLRAKRDEIEHVKKMAASKGNEAEKGEIQRHLIDLQANLEQLATELHYMTQFTGGLANYNNGPSFDTALGKEPQVPITALAKETALRMALPVSVEYFDVSLFDVVDQLHMMTGVNIQIHSGVDRDALISIKLKQSSLAGVLQAIEDITNHRFVIRNYGIMVVPQHMVEELGLVPVDTFIKDYLAIDLASEETIAEANKLKEAK